MAKTGKKKSTKKKSTKKKTTKKKTSKKKSSRRRGADPEKAEGKHLVIVESPTKAKTINRYLGSEYHVMASVGHVRDLPSRAKKGEKKPVPGVDIEKNFEPTYEILPDKKQTVADLKKAAKLASDVWFATDLDREGEAIAWHLAQAVGVDVDQAKRVVFNAITKREIDNAFENPRSIDNHRVNAQQARRILDRIVGYQVSPLLWKKVAGGLSAGRVQSVSVRLVVEREREIEAFIPEEYWRVAGYFGTDISATDEQAQAWQQFLADVAENKERTGRERTIWLNEHAAMQGELVEFGGEKFDANDVDTALKVAAQLGMVEIDRREWEEPKAKGMARFRVRVKAGIDSQGPAYRIRSIDTRRTKTKPPAPFITSTLQQAAANQMGFTLQRAMRVAQQLYEGIDIHGKEGQTGLITYMRTDSTHLSPEAITMGRDYIGKEWGENYLPDKPNVFTKKSAGAQEAHEAVRPTDVHITPKRVRDELTEEQYKLYRLIWERFLASQMVPAQWDSTTVMIESHGEDHPGAAFKANGKTLVFEGFYKATGLPKGEDQILPELTETQPVGPLQVDPTQHFTSPPPRYTEASLQKQLEAEGIGRPSTYAAIIQTIQDRHYVQSVAPRDRRLKATDLGKVVVDKLVEAFPKLMDVDYTRTMEGQLDKIEDEDLDWVHMLQEFYGPFKENLEKAHEQMVHAKAETEPAPHQCPTCGAGTMYRFGRNGRFLSCSQYPDCKYAAPIDENGDPMEPEMTDILCPDCGSGMTKRTGRFGPFLGCVNYPECKGIVKIDKKGAVALPKVPPLETEVPCPKCEAPLYLRDSKRGLWLSCSKFPKCRGRVGFSSLEEDKQAELEKKWNTHKTENPAPIIRNTDDTAIEEGYIPNIAGQDTADDSDQPVEENINQ